MQGEHRNGDGLSVVAFEDTGAQRFVRQVRRVVQC